MVLAFSAVTAATHAATCEERFMTTCKRDQAKGYTITNNLTVVPR